MAAILNAIFGTHPEPEQPNVSNQTVAEQSVSNTECLHTSAVADDVHIKSVISSETHAKAAISSKLNIDELLAQLGTTHAQVDQYSQSRTAEINEQVQKSIGTVLENIKHQQEELLVDANRRHLIIDNEYKLQLQKAVEALDGVKAKVLADLERELHVKQQLIMNDAKKQIDLINDQANVAKINVLVQAQEQEKQNIDHLANQVQAIGLHETENVLQSTTTTVITSQSQAGETVVTAPITETIVTSNVDNQMQVAVRSPTELVLVPTPVIQETVTSVTTDVVTVPVESSVSSTSVDITNNSHTVEAEVKTS